MTLLRLATKNGVRLAAASLSVGHHHAVEAVYHVLHHRARNLLVRLCLTALFVKDVVKVVVPGVIIFP